MNLQDDRKDFQLNGHVPAHLALSDVLNGTAEQLEQTAHTVSTGTACNAERLLLLAGPLLALLADVEKECHRLQAFAPIRVEQKS